jgi:hypothetical protein
MADDWDPIWRYLFPEVVRFPDGQAKTSAKRVMWRSGFCIGLIAWWLLGIGLGLFLYLSGAYSGNWGWGWLPMLPIFAGPSAVLLLLRGRVRRALRTELVRAGVPICIPCGYDLTGNVSGKCPECGTPIESEAAQAKHPPP